MLLISDLEKIAINERKKLTREFEEKYVDLREKVFKVPNNEVEKIVEKLKCPSEIARVAYCIELDGVLNISESVELLIDELQRRTEAGAAVANIPSHLLEFAIEEGKWIEYLYRTFAHEMDKKIREISNNESKIKRDSMSAETAISVFQNRQKVAEGFVLEVMKKWLDEHKKAKPIDAVISMGRATTRWTRDIIHSRLRRIINDLISFMRRVETTLNKEENPSKALKYIVSHVSAIIDGLTKGIDGVTEISGAHLVVHIAPKPDIKPDRSEIVTLGAPFTRKGLVEANMDSPADFLERDVKLAARRPEPARTIYLKKQILTLEHYLYNRGTKREAIIHKIMEMLQDRFSVKEAQIKMIVKEIKEHLKTITPDEHFEASSDMLTAFIIRNIIEGD